MSEQPLILVTGASKGVGRALALALLRDHGCQVIAVARDAAALERLRADAGVAAARLEIVAADITTADIARRLRAQVGARRLHGLVNNAGVLVNRPFGHWGAAELRQVFETNVFAPLHLVQELANALSGDPPGHVVNIGSMGGFQGSAKFPGLMGYSASKAALACATECLAEELKDRQVRANCLCLGAVDTEMLQQAFPGYQAEVAPETMGSHIAEFVLRGHKVLNGKVLPLSLSTP
jgi:3-oxoacyl-[acyl-carrier protein] reductase